MPLSSLPFHGTDFLPQASHPGYAGINYSAARDRSVYQHSWIADAQKVPGEHTVEFGGSVVHTGAILDDTTSTNITFATTQTSNFNSTTGNAFASYLLGVPDSARRQIGGSLGDANTIGYDLYVQDTWRHRALTVNLGLRYDYNSPPVNKYGLGTFDYQQRSNTSGIKANPVTECAGEHPAGGITPGSKQRSRPGSVLLTSSRPRPWSGRRSACFTTVSARITFRRRRASEETGLFEFPQAVSGLNATTVNASLPNPFPGNPQGSATPLICAQCLNVEPGSSPHTIRGGMELFVAASVLSSLTVEASYFGSKGHKAHRADHGQHGYRPGLERHRSPGNSTRNMHLTF